MSPVSHMATNPTTGRVEEVEEEIEEAVDVEVWRCCEADKGDGIPRLIWSKEDIKKHKWFKGFDWNALINLAMTPPIVPELRGEGDTGNFDQYPESDEEDYADDTPLVDEETSDKLFASF